MYFTCKTETVLHVLAACARRSGCSLALCDISQASNVAMEEVEKNVSLLLRHELLERRLDGRVTLAIDPGRVTLGAILRFTQPDLTSKKRGGNRATNNSVVELAVDAASSNFLRIAEQFTIADFLANQRPAKHYVGVCHCPEHDARR